MTQAIRAAGDLFALAVAAAIAGSAYVAAVALGRRSQAAWATTRSTWIVLVSVLALWLAAIAALTLRPQGRAVVEPRSLSLVPFTDLRELFNDAAHTGAPVAHLLGNIALFVPLGLLLPLAFGWSIGRAMAVAIGVSITLEAMQYILGVGRISSVDDVLIAAAGAAMGAVVARLLRGSTPAP